MANPGLWSEFEGDLYGLETSSDPRARLARWFLREPMPMRAGLAEFDDKELASLFGKSTPRTC